MTERLFIKKVKEMRRLQADYQNTGNMKVRSMMVQLQTEIDAAIILFEMQWEKEQPSQMEFPNLFPETTPKIK